MWVKVVIFSLFVTSAYGERAGVRHCDPAEQFPTSPPINAEAPSSAATSEGYLMESEEYMFTCCGVVTGWLIQSTADPADIIFQIWRQYSADNYTVISSWDTTADIGVTIEVPVTSWMSFREGDFIGWYTTTADLVGYVADATGVAVNRHSTAAAPSIGGALDWSSEGAHFGRRYAITALTSPSTPPYFKNLPQRKDYADTDMVTAGVIILTIEANDIDPVDAQPGDLTVTMDPAWTDFFDLSDSLVVSTARPLGAGTYSPEFRVEEDHCGQTRTEVLTIVVTDSSPTITNLPASADVHEDTLDQTLLYTVLLSDPTDQPVWCTDQWEIGSAPSKTPFIVKMISTAAGSSEAGVYLIEWPELDYTTTGPVYELTIICQDTAQNQVTGTLFVNIIQNQAPVFINLPFVVIVDATSVVPGTVVYTVSTSDADGDQITYASSCDSADCPFDLYGCKYCKPQEPA